MLQSQFHILRNEIFYWNLDDFVSISECCLISHKLKVRLGENCMLESEDYKGMTGIVREFEREVDDVHGEGARYTEESKDVNELHL